MASNAFEIMGFAPSFKIDERALEERYYDWTKKLHPDRFAAADAVAKMKIQQNLAEINQAYLALRQPENRLETLLTLVGLLKEEKSSGEQKIPTDLAEEFFEIQEAVMEESPEAKKKIGAFRKQLLGRRDELTKTMYKLADEVDWATAQSGKLDSAARIMDLRRERSYVRSMLENLERLEKSLE